VNSIRRKNVPPAGSLEYWSERTMFAPAAARKVETALMIPGRSGQVMTSRLLTVVKCIPTPTVGFAYSPEGQPLREP
jgi:hypothetical protein